MRYRGNYGIKDLRRDLDGGLGWAHTTESIPTVREAKIKGSFRHTSSQDKTDPKKVVTTSFFKSRGGKLATCHAHGDGTWSIAFTSLGQEELGKHNVAAVGVELDVNVRVEIKEDGLYHHGEMKNKPSACRGHVSLNNDEAHRIHQASDEKETESTISGAKVIAVSSPSEKSGSYERNHTRADIKARPTSHYYRGRPQLSEEQQHLASELANEGLTKKDERLIFQRLKTLPWEEQERILQHSKVLKSKS
ncbi:hypothetical protein PFICI_02680 [Pestalotiopsis fici W106-1]|uniref:Uncharacterized protein n=1 Tax=Pestalotiopsis fici (strain W106-1 / CGMCC3.15140) TaxID=1229662 RepID=W3XF38_PESFW|nr:uncharacterized protein PFICI_02680 [Pestalotiopsis fici W106-1]ETS84655.1 hypothetical protein PFICI_02680 [Pestalotiopsis fici W106-1]